MARKKDKYEIVGEVLEKHDYNIDDLAKLFCRVFKVSCDAIDMDKSNIKKVFYGEGRKFTLSIEMIPHEL